MHSAVEMRSNKTSAPRRGALLPLAFCCAWQRSTRHLAQVLPRCLVYGWGKAYTYKFSSVPTALGTIGYWVQFEEVKKIAS